MITYLALDQYGDTLLLETKHPRKELLEYHSTSRADKIYRDTEDGEPQHVGYIVAGRWYTLYKLTPLNGTDSK